MPESPIRKLAPIADELEANGVKVYRLNIGQPKLACPPEAINAMKSVDMKILEYSPSQGYLHHGQKLAEYLAKFNINVTPDDCVITVGGTEAVLYAFMSCLNPSDEIYSQSQHTQTIWLLLYQQEPCQNYSYYN